MTYEPQSLVRNRLAQESMRLLRVPSHGQLVKVVLELRPRDRICQATAQNLGTTRTAALAAVSGYIQWHRLRCWRYDDLAGQITATCRLLRMRDFCLRMFVYNVLCFTVYTVTRPL